MPGRNTILKKARKRKPNRPRKQLCASEEKQKQHPGRGRNSRPRPERLLQNGHQAAAREIPFQPHLLDKRLFVRQRPAGNAWLRRDLAEISRESFEYRPASISKPRY